MVFDDVGFGLAGYYQQWNGYDNATLGESLYAPVGSTSYNTHMAYVSPFQFILENAVDSPYRESKGYFGNMKVDLHLTDEAVELIATHAAESTRIGARALREVFGKIITALEFDPFSSGKLVKDGNRYTLTITKEMAENTLK